MAIRSLCLCVMLVPLAACGAKSKRHESRIEIIRTEVIRADDKGEPLTIDVEMQFEDCPGDQRKTIRGDRQFSACMRRYKTGEIVPVTIDHAPNEWGDLVPQITKIGECDHRLDPNDEASFEIVQVCSDLVVNSVRVGFRCDRRPSKELLAKCPWFRRH
jgi:hypothetical protein